MTRTKPPATIAALDMDSRVEDDGYEDRLGALQKRLVEIQQAYLGTERSAIVVFEGWDAAGKGGTIRQMSSGLDPRGFHVWPIAAPRPHEREHHYLHRFWERLPGRGGIAVFDRSWYGRVLVERVEGFATPAEWKRAFREIAEFERMLTEDGTRIVKVFLAITPEEQLKRFLKRMDDPLKRWKLSVEDFRNRGRWNDYVAAADEMFEKTDTKNAPWHVLPANHKKFARLAALQAITDHLAEGVDLTPKPLDEAVKEEAARLRG